MSRSPAWVAALVARRDVAFHDPQDTGRTTWSGDTGP